MTISLSLIVTALVFIVYQQQREIERLISEHDRLCRVLQEQEP